MHPSVLLLLLCGWSASSHSLPPKEVPLLPSTNKSAIIDEMLCLLENEDASLDKQLATPTCIRCTNCACNNTDEFIEQLDKLESPCMKIVKSDMTKLRNNCSILKKKSAHENSCTEIRADFLKFRSNLEEFLKWLIRTNNCRNIVRDESDLVGSSESSCSLLQKYCRE
ncbi:interleukin-like precursor [Gallus gallus]|uniref:interleukin-like precursor n=1 Tax=Gallus gallus TaxID=9031 RepID=UPI001AE853BB|nr:interleukin-like precursor [Gallus gallus]